MQSLRKVIRRAVRFAVPPLALLGAVFPSGIAAAATSTISGVAFQDLDRNGVQGPYEVPMPAQILYLFDSGGQFVGGQSTDDTGRYTFGGLVDGTYTVKFSPYSWERLWDDWVPTTTAGVWPARQVALVGTAPADFGWRPITRSLDLAQPVSTATGTDGLRIESFTDAVPAGDVEAGLRRGALVGEEAAATTVRFGFGSSSYCARTSGGSFTATCYVSYRSWLQEGDMTLFHEYGHAWEGFYSHRSGDSDLASYLAARGLTGDPRLESSHAWDRREMIAEDYRQLFGSANAAAGEQENREVPPAAQVPGLETFLRETFRGVATGPPPTTVPPPPTTTTTVPPGATDVFVGDLDGSSTALARGKWAGSVRVSATDSRGAAVGSATVAARWTGDAAKSTGTATCVTDTAGRCTLSVTLDRRQTVATFTVDGVTAEGRTYVASSNRDSDGDSDGTTIRVAKP